MRCPKCHYLSFEPEPRCRNCGFDLGADEPSADLALKVEEPEGDALAELSLRDAEPPKRTRSGLPAMRRRSRAAAATAARVATPEDLHDFDPLPARSERRLVVEPEPDSDAAPAADPEYIRQLDADLEDVREAAAVHQTPVVDEPAPPAEADVEVVEDVLEDLRPIRLVPPTVEPPVMAPPPLMAVPPAPPAPRPSPLMSRRIPTSAPATSELPLFVRGMPTAADDVDERSDAPMVDVPVQPRAPLSVQLRSPEPPRAAGRRPGQFDKDLLEDLRRIEKIERSEAAAYARAGRHATSSGAVGAFARLQSVLVDAGLLAVIAGTIVWLTVKFSGLTMNQIRILPMLPLGGFLLLVTFGYLLLFTAAGGQTVGKMIVGLRVVPDDVPDGRVDVQQAAMRSLVALPAALLLGLGFVPALFGGGRALHDRASGTRVVGA